MAKLRLRWAPDPYLRLGSAAVLAIVLTARSLAEVDGPLRLVRVRGGEYRGAREAARVTEDLWHGLQRFAGMESVSPARPLLILTFEKGLPAGVSFSAGSPPAFLPAHLVIRGDFEERLEELSEQMGRLALWVWAGCPGDPTQPRADWLAVGLAQNLSVYRRSRNRILAWERAEEGSLPEVREILYWIRMPSGPMTEKAICGHFVAWCLAETDGRTRIASLLNILASGGVLAPSRAYEILSAGRTNDVEESWKGWALRREGVPSGGLPLTPFCIRHARKAAGFPPAELRLSALLGDTPLSPFQALALRRHSLMTVAVQNRLRELRLAAIGAPEEVASILLDSQRFYLQMTGWTPLFVLRRKALELNQRLARLEERTLALQEWLDEWDSEVLFEESGWPSGE